MVMDHILLWCLFYNIGRCLSFDAFIVDGEKTNIASFRHSAYLKVLCDDSDDEKNMKSWTCGASIVNQRVLLTAAHCIRPCSTPEAVVKIGNIRHEKGLPFRLSKKKGKIHENYDNITFANDICVLTLNRDIEFGYLVGRVSLMDDPPSGEAYITGWGYRFHDKKKPEDRIRYSKQQVIDDTLCFKMMDMLKPDGTFCALPLKGYPVSSDSGGALVFYDFIQIGVYSYTMPPVQLSVYTNTSYFLGWIRQAVSEIFCDI